jgi:hypothetical protein
MPAEPTIVFGLQARASGIFVPNDAVAAFVRQVGGGTVGFMSRWLILGRCLGQAFRSRGS